MERIKIGITKGKESLKGEEYYMKAIEKVGGEVEMLPPSSNEGKLGEIKGLLLPGGGDIHPLFYGEENQGSENIDERRDEWEINLARRFREEGKPILGICRGMQVLNVAFGGSLYQDIKGHRNRHLIEIEEGSLLYEIMGRRKQIEVNSSHHQGIKVVAPSLRATAWSGDKHIEGVEGKGEEFLLGVQFHPERLIEDKEIFLNIFKSFLNACRKEVFTLGTSKRSYEEFLQILRYYEIEEVIDVRRFPKSKFEWFEKENLKRKLWEEGLFYVWMGDELGGYRSPNYEAYMQTEEFRNGLRKLIMHASIKRVAIVCAEALPWRCHRRFIASALKEEGWQTRHILDKEKEWKPRGELPFEEEERP